MSRKVVPLSSLVVLVGPAGGGKSTLCAQHFDPGEVVSTDAIRQELLGDFRRQDNLIAVFDEYYHRIKMRLSLGLRVVADATHVRDGDRLRVAGFGKSFGVPVVYMVVNRSVGAKYSAAGWRANVRVKNLSLIDADEQTFVANERKILSGDNIATTVIDTRTEDFHVVQKFTRDSRAVLDEMLDRGFNRIRFIGDVHGNLEGLRKACNVEPNVFLQFLGDIPDYGVGTITASTIVARMVREGRAGNLVGNHEAKVAKFLRKERQRIEHTDVFGDPSPDFPGFGGTVSHGNAVTFNQIKAMPPEKWQHFETQFLGLFENSPDHIVMDADNGRFAMVHGALRPASFDRDLFRFDPETRDWELAMFGQVVPKEYVVDDHGNRFPKRIYEWTNDIPARHTVLVGHDVQSREAPVVMTSPVGGRTVFLDTGSSKEGKLSWFDMEIVERKDKLSLIEIGYGSE
jgi:hypothetical protein